MPSSRVRAASMSMSVGAVFVTVNAEHLLQDLSDCAQRIELPTLYLVEQAPELGIFAHGCLQMPVCPRRGDREHLAGEVARPPLLELPRLLEELAVLLELLPKLRDVLAARRLREDDRRAPVAILVERQDRAHL